MIPYYPALYRGEILYSGNARFTDQSCYPTIGDVNSALFGARSVVATVEFPSHLAAFLNNLPYYYQLSFDELIRCHTLFPYYAPFMPAATKNRLQKDMLGKGYALHMRSGLMASKIHAIKRLRFCPNCVREDRTAYGETFWHVLPQIQGILFCPSHKQLFEESDVLIRQGTSRFKYISADSIIDAHYPIYTKIEVPQAQILLSMAEDAAWLLEHYEEGLCLEAVKERYQKIYKMGNRTPFRTSKLAQEFCDFYDEETLRVLGCEIDDGIIDSWLVKLIRGKLITHNPIRHLLFIRFLGYSLDEFLHFKPQVRLPFGKGPWPCLSPICKAFGKNVIVKCEIKFSPYVMGATFGIFSCDSCGYTYRMKTDTSENAEKAYIEGVLDYGPVWKKELSKLWIRRDVSLRSIAKRLAVDPKTVQKQAAILGLEFPRYGGRNKHYRLSFVNSSTSPQNETAKLRKIYRKAWLQEFKAKNKSTTAIRKQLPKEYMWLYRHDRDWLIKHKPQRQKPKTIRERVDWESRDKLISELIAEATRFILSKPGKPRQLTITELGRTAGCLPIIQQHLSSCL
jgi:hypothetical protein